MVLDDEATLDARPEVVAVLDGERQPLDPASAQVLLKMLLQRSGSDVLVGRCQFEASCGAYQPEVAGPILSQLMEWAGIQQPTRRLRTVFRPDGRDPFLDIPWPDAPLYFSLDAEGANLTFSMRPKRDATADVPERPPPLPARAPRFMAYDQAVPCPHCGRLAQLFRWLFQGSLVCGSCGASFEPPAQPAGRLSPPG